MKALSTIILFLFTLQIYSQRVIREGVADDAYNQAKIKTNKLRDEISLAWKKIEPIIQSHSNDKDDIQRYIDHNAKVKTQLQGSGIDRKCREINRIWNAVDKNWKNQPCNTAASRIKNIDERIYRAKELLEEKRKDSDFNKSQNLLDKLNKDKVDKLDREIKSLNEKLRRSEQSLSNTKKKKRMSLDQFVAKRSNKSTKSKSLDNFLKSKSSQSLSSKTASNSKSKSLTDHLNTGSDSSLLTSFEIKRKGELMGVVSNSGKTLIPFKNWTVVNYKYGIAEVRKYLRKKTICKNSITTHKVGFVDDSGSFIDGYDIDVSVNYYSPPERLSIKSLDVYRWDNSLSSEENWRREKIYERNKQRREREAARKAQIARKKEEMEKKRCKIQMNQYIQSQYLN